MAGKNENMITEYMDKLQEWWKTDTAKAVATIVAVLLIPASVLAWNYYTSDDKAVTEENSNQNATLSENQEEDLIQEEDSQSIDTVDSTDSFTSNSDIDNPAVGGASEVTELPNTSSTESINYAVKTGDNVYKISLKVCGNNSFYISHMRKNYLKVAETIKVTCE